MRKILILLTALLMCGAVNVSAQEDAQATSKFKRFENNFYIGAGAFLDHYNEPHNQSKYFRTDNGLSVKLGYGLNYYFTEKFSLMAGVAYRNEETNVFRDLDGADDDSFTFVDVPVTFQVHLNDPQTTNNKWMIGLGLVYSQCQSKCDYYIDADPNDPLDGKTKIKDNYVSLMPCAAYEIKHFRFGVEAYIGLNDVNRKYEGLVNGERRLSNICGVVAFKF
ncbi:MAG: outer membrane beta-barrel protein [Bacteroidales bacterium]|nr:outer membrane beta-barrel protein [Bacteroidales bacterium]